MSAVRTDPGNLRGRSTPPDGPLDDNEIRALLHRKIDNALNQDDGELSEIRERTLDYYRGGPIGQEDPDRSTYRTREVFEMVEWSLPSAMSTFFSAKQPIVFEPNYFKSIEIAQQETDYIDHLLFRRENSFIEFHNAFKSALLDPVAYGKVHCRHVEDAIAHKYDELTEMQLVKLVQEHTWKEDDLEIEPYYMDQHGEYIPEEEVPQRLQMGEPLERRFKFEGIEEKTDPQFFVDAVPPEQILVEQNATKLDLDDVFNDYGMICHKTDVPYTELVKRGYDPEELNEVGAHEFEVRYNDERTNRMYREDERPDQSQETDFSTRLFTVYECYWKFDADGDGIAEGRRVVMIGNNIFENERCEYQPFVAVSLVPMPFKHAGISPAEAMLDQQELSTVLTRNMLDETYRLTNRRYIANRQVMLPNKRTHDQIRNTEEAVIEVNGDVSQIRQEADNPIIESLLPIIQYNDDRVKKRTGIAPENSLNPDVLRDATAHGMLASMDKTSQRLMHYVRLFAELYVKKVAKKMHTLVRMHQDKSFITKLRGKFIEVDPASWQESPNVKVTVGLGFNTKEQRLAALTQLLGLQKEALGQNMADPMKMYNTLSQLIESADLGFVDEFFIEPDPEKGWKPPEPPPDPQMEQVKAYKEVETGKNQAKMAEVDMQKTRGQLEHQTKMAQLEAEKAKIDAEIVLKKADQERQAALFLEEKQVSVEKLVAERDKLIAERRKILADAQLAEVESSETVREAQKTVSGDDE